MQLRRVVKHHREWIRDNGAFVKRKSTRNVERDLDEATYDSAKTIKIGLSGMATYYGIRGLVDLLANKDGWQDVDLSVQFRYWGVKFSSGVVFRELQHGLPPSPLRLHHELPRCASLFCYSVVHDLKDWRNEHWDLMKRIVLNPLTMRDSDWEEEEPYMLCILKLFSRSPLTDCFVFPAELEGLLLDSYKKLLTHWDNPREIQHSLTAVCDYHCQQMEQATSRDPWPSFIDTPFDLIPYEILAILKLRSLLGLETPEIDHPLMALPTSIISNRKIQLSNDPIFERLRQFYVKRIAQTVDRD